MQCCPAPQNQECCIYELKWTWAQCLHLSKDSSWTAWLKIKAVSSFNTSGTTCPKQQHHTTHDSSLQAPFKWQNDYWWTTQSTSHLQTDRHFQCHFKPSTKHYTYLFAISVLKVGGRLHTPRLITAKPMLLLGLVPTPISVRPILQNTITNMSRQCAGANRHYCLQGRSAVSINRQVQVKPQRNGTVKAQLLPRLTWSSPCASHFTLCERATSTHWTGGSVNTTASKNAMEKRKSPAPARNCNWTTIAW